MGLRRCVEEMYLGFYYNRISSVRTDRIAFLHWAQKCVKSDLARSCVSMEHSCQDDNEIDLDH